MTTCLGCGAKGVVVPVVVVAEAVRTVDMVVGVAPTEVPVPVEDMATWAVSEVAEAEAAEMVALEVAEARATYVTHTATSLASWAA